MVDDPDSGHAASQLAGQGISRQFDVTYGDLLRALHQTVNGHPEGLNEAIGLMYAVEVPARGTDADPDQRGPARQHGPAFLAE